MKFRRLVKYRKGIKIFDVGWRMEIGKLKIRWNKQLCYTALAFEYGRHSYPQTSVKGESKNEG